MRRRGLSHKGCQGLAFSHWRLLAEYSNPAPRAIGHAYLQRIRFRHSGQQKEDIDAQEDNRVKGITFSPRGCLRRRRTDYEEVINQCSAARKCCSG
jgi:hypothetical protein